MSIYDISVTALRAAQIGIATTGHNIANVNTPGYRRQEVEVATNVAVRTGSGFIGQGVVVSTVRRVYDDFLERQVGQSESQWAYLNQYLQSIQQIDNVLGDRSSGISSLLQKFFASWNAVANDPTSTSARQGVLTAANTLADNVNRLGDYLQSLQDSVNSDIQSLVAQINSTAASLASTNDRIASVQNSGQQPPNDLLDQRDRLVSQLNQMAGVTVVRDPTTGDYNVFLARGYQLVAGSRANPISADASYYDPLRIEVFDRTGNIQLSGNAMLGGQLGALLDYRAHELDAAQNALGRIAMALTQSVNDQHRLGQDMNGAAGGLLFSDLSGQAQVYSNVGNTSGAVVTATVNAASQLTTSDYRLSYDGTNYTLTRLSDGQSWSNASIATLANTAAQGFSLSISTTPNAGESFYIRPTAAAATGMGVEILDPALLAVAAPVRSSAAGANTGTARITQPVVDTSTQPPLNPNLTQTVTITFTSPTTYDVVGTGTGNPTGVAYVSGGSISFNGWTVQISGTPAAGDVFTIGPNTGGIMDNRNALAIAALQTDHTVVAGGNTLEGAYGLMVSGIGDRTAAIKINQEAQKNLYDQAVQTQQSASGVNLDEEAANLIRYQQSYQAAAQLIKTANTMFDTLLSLG